jgi:hypothetical protein
MVRRAAIRRRSTGGFFVMIRIMAIAAMIGGFMAVPVATPTQAATMGANCLILPLLQADCRAAISEAISAHHAAVATAVAAPRAAAHKVAAADVPKLPHLLFWWTNCHRAEAGAKHLFDCD